MKNSIKAIGMALILGTTSATAAPLTIPNTFTAGTPAVAADVNANFAATAASVNDIEARLAALEAVNDPAPTTASAAGTWAFTIDQFFVAVPGVNTVHLSRETVRGTLLINANGTFSGSITGGLDVAGGLQNAGRCVDAGGATVPCTSPNSVGQVFDQTIVFTGPNPPGGISGTFAITGNGATIAIPGNFPLNGHISQNGQTMLLEGNDPATHINLFMTLIKIQ